MKKMFGAINFARRNWKPLNYQLFVLNQKAKCTPHFWFTTIQNKRTQTKVQKLRKMNKLKKKGMFINFTKIHNTLHKHSFQPKPTLSRLLPQKKKPYSQ
jgi:hypothetical protein